MKHDTVKVAGHLNRKFRVQSYSGTTAAEQVSLMSAQSPYVPQNVVWLNGLGHKWIQTTTWDIH